MMEITIPDELHNKIIRVAAHLGITAEEFILRALQFKLLEWEEKKEQ